jgi:hypothetical protein
MNDFVEICKWQNVLMTLQVLADLHSEYGGVRICIQPEGVSVNYNTRSCVLFWVVMQLRLALGSYLSICAMLYNIPEEQIT